MPVTLEEILQRIDHIPEPPKTALQALTMIEDPDMPIAKIADYLSLDECLTSKLLRLSNTAYYAGAQKIETIRDAVVRLGIDTVKSALFFSLLEQSRFEINPFFVELWKSALFSAFAAKDAGTLLKHPRPDICFTGGLLCDIGQLMINDANSKVNSNLVQRVLDEKLRLPEAEFQVYGFTHVQIGYKIAEVWNLPEPYRQVIQYHHNPVDIEPKTSVEDRQLVTAVHIGNLMSPLFGDQSIGLIYTSALEQAGFFQDKRTLYNHLKGHFNNYYQEINAITDSMFGDVVTIP